MLIPLIIGLIVGGLSVVFILQNVMPITVAFLSWHFTGSLAFVLFAAIGSGALIAILLLLPSIIRDDLYMAVIRRQKKELEDELAARRERQEGAAAPATGLAEKPF